MTSSSFAYLPGVPSDEIFGLLHEFQNDSHPKRVNLAAGIYRTDEDKSWPLDIVCKVEKQLYEEASQTRHDYLPIEGDMQFVGLAQNLLFAPIGDRLAESETLRIASVQTISGTGANHLGALFVAQNLRPQNLWVSDPTWANHHIIWEAVGLVPRLYPYYRKSDHLLNFDGMIQTLEEAQPGDCVLLHACAHNPTGIDPSKDQWKVIAELCRRKQLIPFFDAAYQGFASGDPEQDAWVIRYFFQQRVDMLIAQSFSKNFGIYGHRVGAIHVVLSEPSAVTKANVFSNLCHLLRSEISMAPKYGSTIVKKVLASSDLTAEWVADLQVMSGRLKSMRMALYDELIRLDTPGSWEHIVKQIGMFTYTGLSIGEVRRLRTEFHIYLLDSGRISISGLNSRNVNYVAKAFHDVRMKTLECGINGGTNGHREH
ncbi:aspartate aminotransferase [Fusarium flagelliforme]|uniref:Aspartate aminotransferase n=1 Tax=Fusarium flagelliforme TaxID=2675880 RepID=A0A395MYI5_9HYPO|nr:aspartate aminotransferase [Fusarium flagelliforme]